VTTNAGGIPDIVTDRVTGILVPLGDYEQMAQRAIELLNDGAFAESMIERARQECAKYSWDAVRDSWLNVYHTLGSVEVAKAMETHSNSEPKALPR
jgi:Glycosyltransferase